MFELDNRQKILLALHNAALLHPQNPAITIGEIRSSTGIGYSDAFAAIVELRSLGYLEQPSYIPSFSRSLDSSFCKLSENKGKYFAKRLSVACGKLGK